MESLGLQKNDLLKKYWKITQVLDITPLMLINASVCTIVRNVKPIPCSFHKSTDKLGF